MPNLVEGFQLRFMLKLDFFYRVECEIVVDNKEIINGIFKVACPT